MTITLHDAWLMIRAGLLVLLIPMTLLGEEAPGDLDRWVGNYAMGGEQVMRIDRDEDRLAATPPGNRPPATLVPDRKPGRFSIREAQLEFQFVTDASGRVTQLEITGLDGKVRRLPRVTDTSAALASVRATAVRAHTAVNARVFNGYERARDSEGKFLRETYVFGEGGFMSTNPSHDPALQDMTFDELALSLAPGLASQGYVSGRETDKIDLLVMVYWGATASADHPVGAAFRDQLNRENARLLGFESVLAQSDLLLRSVSVAARDSFERLEESRYWVALVAVDFRLFRLEKTTKPLWSVRYNISSRGVSFTKALPQMTQVASHFFGRDSDGLLERGTSDVKGTVELGELIVIEEDEAAATEDRAPGGRATTTTRDR